MLVITRSMKAQTVIIGDNIRLTLQGITPEYGALYCLKGARQHKRNLRPTH